jgi:uncharacterized C2H2 Zn-finger protein
MMVEINDKKESKIFRDDFEKLDTLELIIIPKDKFLEWFEHTKGQIEDIEKNQMDNCSLECPNCSTLMQEYIIRNRDKELWHICPKCNLSFSQRQHYYFKKMITRLIENDSI